MLRSSRITSLIPIKSNNWNYWREGRKGLFKFRKIKNLNSHRTISYLTEDHRPRAVWLQGSAREGKIREWTRKRWFGGLEPTGDERRKSVSWGILGLGFPRLAISTGHEGGDGWPRTGGQVKQTEGGREGVQMAERKVAGRSRGRQSLGIGWRLFSASTSISICFQRRNEFVFSFVLARSSTRACGSRFAMERTGIGSSRITGNYSIL